MSILGNMVLAGLLTVGMARAETCVPPNVARRVVSAPSGEGLMALLVCPRQRLNICWVDSRVFLGGGMEGIVCLSPEQNAEAETRGR